MSKWKSNVSAVTEELTATVVEKVNTKAEQYETDIKTKLAQGYTTGAFVTGEDAASVEMSPATAEDPQASIGTNSIIAIAWALGHVNLFTRRFERVDYWTETANELGAKGIE